MDAGTAGRPDDDLSATGAAARPWRGRGRGSTVLLLVAFTGTLLLWLQVRPPAAGIGPATAPTASSGPAPTADPATAPPAATAPEPGALTGTVATDTQVPGTDTATVTPTAVPEPATGSAEAETTPAAPAATDVPPTTGASPSPTEATATAPP